MDPQDDHASREPRLPTVEDLVFLCGHLNETGARYVVVGGMAIIEHGLGRTTEDVDLLVDPSPENFERIRQAMIALPDGAIREVRPTDIDEFTVVRVGDEFVIDLMKSACGVTFAEASRDISWREVKGVRIPFASPRLLWRMKQTYREKDAYDRLYLAGLLKQLGQEPPR